MNLPTKTDIQNWCHAALAVLGFLSLVFGMVTAVFATLDPAIQAKYAFEMALTGGLLLVASKAIDAVANFVNLRTAALAVKPGK